MIARSHGECLRMILQKYLDAAQDLLRCLQDESDALTQSDTDRIQSLAEQKVTHLQLFDVFVDEIAEFAAMVGLSNENFQALDIHQLIEQCMDDQQSILRTTWTELTSILRECQNLNAINGAVVTVRANSVQRTLNLLLHGTDDPVVSYDDKGSVQAQTSVHCEAEV